MKEAIVIVGPVALLLLIGMAFITGFETAFLLVALALIGTWIIVAWVEYAIEHLL